MGITGSGSKRAGDTTRDGLAADGTVPPAARVRGPRWRDARLLVGLLLILASVAVGARLYATADRTTAVWAATRDLDAGAVLARDDLARRYVRLLDVTSKYLAAETAPVGYMLTRAVGDGELLPSAAVRKPSEAAERRLVTVTVSRERLPAELAAGSRVDVYVTPAERSGDPQPAELVIAAASVATVGDSGRGLGSAGADVGVELAVPPDQVAELIDASRHGKVDLVKLPLGSSAESTPTDGP